MMRHRPCSTRSLPPGRSKPDSQIEETPTWMEWRLSSRPARLGKWRQISSCAAALIDLRRDAHAVTLGVVQQSVTGFVEFKVVDHAFFAQVNSAVAGRAIVRHELDRLNLFCAKRQGGGVDVDGIVRLVALTVQRPMTYNGCRNVIGPGWRGGKQGGDDCYNCDVAHGDSSGAEALRHRSGRSSIRGHGWLDNAGFILPLTQSDICHQMRTWDVQAAVNLPAASRYFRCARAATSSAWWL